MARLDELFEVKNGLASAQVSLLERRTDKSIPYIRPSSTQQRTVAGWVDRATVSLAHIHPAHSLFVSTDGEGSHTHAYVSTFEFVANSNVCVLMPKRDMSLAEKIFYAKAITLNRAKFSYGRKPKGERLKAIVLPDDAPSWVNGNALRAVSLDVGANLTRPSKKRTQIARDSKSVRLEDLFDVKYGTNLELNRMTENAHGVNFVARTAQNNGVSARVNQVVGVEPTEPTVLTVAGGGSVLETFLQTEPFYSGRDLYYLRPKAAMTLDEMLFYATCIRANQYKYSYGRQANKTLRDLPIPALESLPTWVNGALQRVSNEIKTNASIGV